MPSPRHIRRRIKSIASTAQITRAMQMVAASKMRKAQQATLRTRPFARLLYRIQRRVATHTPGEPHPLLMPREVRRRGVILVGTDKGLCGGLNANLFRLAQEFDPATTTFIAVGKRAAQFVARTRRTLVAEFTYSDTPRFDEAKPIAAFARDLFLKGEVDEVRVIGTGFHNTLRQQAVVVEFLPIGEITLLKMSGVIPEEEQEQDDYEYLFEPGAEAVLPLLFNGYLNIFMFRVLLEARASEQSARMVSMKNATDNAMALIRDLTLEYNNLRQGNITRELLEIAGGQLGNE